MSTKRHRPDEDIEQAMVEISKLRACGLLLPKSYETLWTSLENWRTARVIARAKHRPENLGLPTPKKSAS